MSDFGNLFGHLRPPHCYPTTQPYWKTSVWWCHSTAEPGFSMSCGYGPKALLRFTGASWFLLLCFPASHLCTLLLCSMTAVTDILPNFLSVLDFAYSVSCPWNVVSPSPLILLCGYFFFFLVGVQEAHRNLFPSSSYAFHSSFISCGFGSQFSCWQLLTFKPYLLSIYCRGRQWVCLFIYVAVTTVSFLGGLMPTSNDPGAPCSQLFWPLLSSFLSFMLFVFLSRNALCKVHPARGLADSCLWALFFHAGPTPYHVLEADLMGSSAVSLGVSLFSLLFRGLFACPLELRTAELLST